MARQQHVTTALSPRSAPPGTAATSTQAALVSPADANGITPTLSLHPFPRHEDGTVRFWDASGVSLKPLYKLGTANIFQTDCEHNDSLNQAGEEEWPPFRKVMSAGLGGGTRTMLQPPAPSAWGGMCLWEPSQLHCGDVSPRSGHSCCLSDTRDACSARPDPRVCPGLGGGPWDTGDA